MIDSRTGQLSLRLLDMHARRRQGRKAAVAVSAEGAYTLPGFSGSAVQSQSLTVEVENLADMISLIRDNYSGRLVDILDIKTA